MALLANLGIGISVEDAQLRQGLTRAERTVRNFSRRASQELMSASVALAGIGLSAGVALRSLANFGDELIKNARSVGSNVTEYQQLQMAFAFAGIQQSQFLNTQTQLQRVIGEAGQGLGGATRAFENLGISLDEIREQSPSQQLLTVLDALRAIENPADRAAVANQVLGRAFRSLGSVLAVSNEELLSSVEGLNLVTTGSAEAAERFNDSIDAIGATFRSAALNAAQPILDGIATALDAIARNGRLVRALIAGIGAAFVVVTSISILRGLRALVNVIIAARTAAMGLAFFTSLSSAGVATLAGAAAFTAVTAGYYALADAAEDASLQIDKSADAIMRVTTAATGDDDITPVCDIETSLTDASTAVTKLADDFTSLGSTIQTSLRDTLVDSFRTGMFSASSFFDSITNQILQISANALTNNILGSIFGGQGSGNPVNSGGTFFGFQRGGVVPNTPSSRAGVDSVPALLTPGEIVLPVQGSGEGININFNITGDIGRQTIRTIQNRAEEVADIVANSFRERGAL